MYLKNAVLHFRLITYHKWLVFKLCCKIGQPWRGFVHDFSKYSPTEFFESVKFYIGTHSPISEAKKSKGYSNAWLHHKGRNKHHPQYWVDESAPEVTPVMPYPYAAEMICDKLAAGMAYKGKNFTDEYELEYWKHEKEKIQINPKTERFVTEVLTEIAKKGIKEGLTKAKLKNAYEKYCK